MLEETLAKIEIEYGYGSFESKPSQLQLFITGELFFNKHHYVCSYYIEPEDWNILNEDEKQKAKIEACIGILKSKINTLEKIRDGKHIEVWHLDD